MENASRFYGHEKVKKMIERQKKRYGWEFMFLGANIDAIDVANNLGIDESRAVNFNCDSEGTALNYEVVGDTIESLRRCEFIDDSWKDRIDDDFRKRG